MSFPLEKLECALVRASNDPHSAASTTVVVRVTSGSITGWGECAPGDFPNENGEWNAGAMLLIESVLGPKLIGQWISSRDSLKDLARSFLGCPAALSAVMNAVEGLHPTSVDTSNEGLPALIYLGEQTDDLNDLFTLIAELSDAGCSGVVLPMGPSRDAQTLRAFRTKFPRLKLVLDGKCAYEDHNRDLLHRLDDFHVAALLDPLAKDDVIGHAMLQEVLSTPIWLRCGPTSQTQAERFFDLSPCRGIVLDLGRIGGNAPMQEMARQAQHAQCKVVVASELASPIAFLHSWLAAHETRAESFIIPSSALRTARRPNGFCEMKDGLVQPLVGFEQVGHDCLQPDRVLKRFELRA